MPTIDSYTSLNLVELAKRTGNGNLLLIAEVLTEKNAIVQDAFWVQANQLTSHKITRRQALASGTWRQLNKGVPAEVTETRQIVEPIGMLESYSKVDKVLANLAPNPQQFRSDEDMGFVEGMSQTLADALIYGAITSNPDSFDGFATRYNALSLANVYDGGGSANRTSIYIVKWGERGDGCHVIYPRASESMGINVSDLGEDTVLDASSNEYQAYRTHFQVFSGLCVRDDRAFARIPNIDSTAAWSSSKIDDIIIEALNNFWSLDATVIYVNRAIMTAMDIQAKDKTNVYYTTGEVWGHPTTMFRGIPVRLVDAILNTEAAVA